MENKKNDDEHEKEIKLLFKDKNDNELLVDNTDGLVFGLDSNNHLLRFSDFLTLLNESGLKYELRKIGRKLVAEFPDFVNSDDEK